MTCLDSLRDCYPNAHKHISLIPVHMQDAVALWIVHGIEPESFLTAVLCNNLKEAVGQADPINGDCLFEWVQFFHNHAPYECWGSEERAAAWAKRGGLRGHKTEDAA